jgi:ABC-type phosphate transport system substrate-binding protein
VGNPVPLLNIIAREKTMKKILLTFMTVLLLSASSAGVSAEELSPATNELALQGASSDALVVIVNSMNPVRSMGTSQLQKVFSHQIRAWHMIGGSHEMSIRVILSGLDNPALEIFQKRIMGGRSFVGQETFRGDSAVLHEVSRDEAAIGLVRLSEALHQKGVRILAVDYQKAALDNRNYPLLFP